jgi:hypothetical protein
MSDSIGVAVADGDPMGVSVGSGVADGLGVDDVVGVAVLVGNGIAVPLTATIGADSPPQANRESVRPIQSHAFLIFAFACRSRRIAVSPESVPGLSAPYHAKCDQAYSLPAASEAQIRLGCDSTPAVGEQL